MSTPVAHPLSCGRYKCSSWPWVGKRGRQAPGRRESLPPCVCAQCRLRKHLVCSLSPPTLPSFHSLPSYCELSAMLNAEDRGGRDSAPALKDVSPRTTEGADKQTDPNATWQGPWRNNSAVGSQRRTWFPVHGAWAPLTGGLEWANICQAGERFGWGHSRPRNNMYKSTVRARCCGGRRWRSLCGRRLWDSGREGRSGSVSVGGCRANQEGWPEHRLTVDEVLKAEARCSDSLLGREHGSCVEECPGEE